MWPKVYKDYPVDTPLKQYQLSAGKGIQGCEMHELNGFGDSLHFRVEKHRSKGLLRRLLQRLESFFRKEDV